jgi:hypothetical protein
VSELLELRVIGAPAAAEQAVVRLQELLDLDRQNGPYPSRKRPELVRYYLTGRLRHHSQPPASGPDEHVWDTNGVCQRHGGDCSMAPTSPDGGEVQ